MGRLSDLSPSIIWVFLIFTLSLSSATRQIIWLMSLAGLVMFARSPRDFLETEGIRKFWIVLACFLLPAVFSLFGAINLERSLSGAVRFLAYGFAVWVLLQIKFDRSESHRLMSLVGAVMMLWVIDGLVQLLTGYSVFGNPLIELDSGQALVTGSLRTGYGSTLAILSPFYLEALRRTGGGALNSILALPLFAAIVMSGNEASMVHALAALAGYAFILRRPAPDAPVTSSLQSSPLAFSLAVLAGIMLGDTFSESVVGQAASDAYKAFDYLPVFWESAWSGFTDHWINGVGIRGWGSMVVSMESITVLPVSERWHPHMYALEVAVDTGVPGLIGYGLFFIFLGRRLFDARSEVALTSLVVILALFPLNSSVSFYSYFNGNILFLTLALLIALDRDIKPLPELDSLGQPDATGLQ
ncbi:MAG: O-antigen ligase family protein [Halieaceae bacterium]